MDVLWFLKLIIHHRLSNKRLKYLSLLLLCILAILLLCELLRGEYREQIVRASLWINCHQPQYLFIFNKFNYIIVIIINLHYLLLNHYHEHSYYRHLIMHV